MLSRFLIPALLVCAAGMQAFSPSPAKAGEAQSFYYEQQLSRYCAPPLKFAAGACVPFCPAGFRDMGGYCRLLNQSEPNGSRW